MAYLPEFSLPGFLKENQEAFEEGMKLNMGQWLSIPMVAFGLFLLFRAWKSGFKS
jgi:phosphatidylglycerol:prolipoprotein diacylglycerol transferase